MGVAPREPGRLFTRPPRQNGGNLAIRRLTVGATAYFPVLVLGALFSCGDCHAAQGDGEINGAGIESPMTITHRFDLRKGERIPELRFTTPPKQVLNPAGACGYFATTAHGSDLYANTQ